MFSRMGKLSRRQRFLLPVLLGVVATAADAAASGWPLQPFVSGNPTSTVGAQSLLCRLGSLQSPEEDGLVLAVPYHELSRWHSTNILPVYILDSAVRTFFPRYLLNPSSLFSIWCSSRFALLLYTSVWRGCSLAVCSVSPLFGASLRCLSSAFLLPSTKRLRFYLSPSRSRFSVFGARTEL